MMSYEGLRAQPALESPKIKEYGKFSDVA